jgi:hypothetical protein
MTNFNWEKFKALVHYICGKASDQTAVLGAIKLNKVLWYSDTIFYQIKGESITGESYVKRQFGPVPRHVLQALDSLIKDGKIARGHVDHFGFTKTEYFTIHDADVSLFSSEEIALIDKSFEHVCLNHTARSISEETHSIIWEMAAMGEEMPYCTVFAANDGEITEGDVAWANEVLESVA